jgi:acetyltransferase-like isoleucine patch superfamily enzyme
LKPILKKSIRAIFLLIALPLALLSAFGRFKPLYSLWAQTCALAPGLPGDYLRVAYYRLTLERCSPESRVQFGSTFAHREARVGHNVFVGSYCVLGKTTIGARTQIASGVQIISGGRQHLRDAEGRISAEHGAFETIAIGADCWIGAGSIVLADVGAGSTIGAGSVVVRPIPANSVAVGNPARVLPARDGQPA